MPFTCEVIVKGEVLAQFKIAAKVRRANVLLRNSAADVCHNRAKNFI
jgi:hypothetical protein